MPPRKGFGLSLHLPADSAAAPPVGHAELHPTLPPSSGRALDASVGGRAGALRDSWEVGADGALTALTKSVTPYEFSRAGLLIRSGGGAGGGGGGARGPPGTAAGGGVGYGPAGSSSSTSLGAGGSGAVGLGPSSSQQQQQQQHYHNQQQQQYQQQQYQHQQQPQNYRVAEADIVPLRVLGRGASGVVLKGFLRREGRFVAVKRVSILSREARAQVLNDVRALCDAPPGGPGLVAFVGAYHSPEAGAVCVVLEHMDAGSLADLLARVAPRPVPEPVIGRVAGRVLAGLAALHRRRLVHRDVKPANILLNLQGEAKISDFGISAFVANTVANCNTFTGTVTYMSPERIEGRPYGFPADVWAVGLVVLEAAVGRYPYDARGAGPVELMVQILQDEPPLPPPGAASAELCDFVRRCLAVDPARRPTAEQLLAHPFIVRYNTAPPLLPPPPPSQQQQQQQADPVGAEARRYFAAVAADPLERLDEIALRFAHAYYGALSRGLEGLRRLGGLYAPDSRLRHPGDAAGAVGRDAIIARQAALVAAHSSGSGSSGGGTTSDAAAAAPAQWVIRVADSQPLGADGTMLVHIQGSIEPTPTTFASEGGGGGGGSGNGSGSGHSFAECFLLKRSPAGEYFIANQSQAYM